MMHLFMTDKTLGEACAADLETPCDCSTLSVACAKQIDIWETCLDNFQTYYDLQSQCVENETPALPPPTMTAAPMLFFMCMMVVTLLMFLWCAFNQRLAPVFGSTSELENEHGEKWTQTGYKSTIVGQALYGLVILGHLSIQVLLLLTSIYYCKWYYILSRSFAATLNSSLIIHSHLQTKDTTLSMKTKYYVPSPSSGWLGSSGASCSNIHLRYIRCSCAVLLLNMPITWLSRLRFVKLIPSTKRKGLQISLNS